MLHAIRGVGIRWDGGDVSPPNIRDSYMHLFHPRNSPQLQKLFDFEFFYYVGATQRSTEAGDNKESETPFA